MKKGNNIPDDSWYRNLSGRAVGRYKLEDFKGKGRIGYVYRASCLDIHDMVRAVKLTFDALKPDWKNEVKKVAKLDRVDGVVHFHELGQVELDSRLAQFTVWDYISPGENLRDYLKRVHSVSTTFLCAVIEQILKVLHACQKQGIPRHGDLHSGNILIGDPDESKLDDTLLTRAPIYVSDFGYGTTGGFNKPKSDYEGLAKIINEILEHIDRSRTSIFD